MNRKKNLVTKFLKDYSKSKNFNIEKIYEILKFYCLLFVPIEDNFKCFYGICECEDCYLSNIMVVYIKILFESELKF